MAFVLIFTAFKRYLYPVFCPLFASLPDANRRGNNQGTAAGRDPMGGGLVKRGLHTGAADIHNPM